MAGYDPSLYASTGSWAGLPYGTPSYGPPGEYYPEPYGPPTAGYPAPSAAFAGPPGEGMYGSFRQTGPAYQVPASPYAGPAPPADMYRGGFRGYGPPMGYPSAYGGPMPPSQQARPKVYGVGILFAEQTDQMGRVEVIVKDVYQNTPAAATGRVKPGDLLKTVNGQNVEGKAIRELRAHVPGPLGSPVNLGFEGQGGTYDIDVERVQAGRGTATVFGGRGAGPSGPRPQAPQQPQSTEGKAYVGFSVQQTGDPRVPEYIVANVTAESTADQKGLQQGDQIYTINGKEVRGMHEEEVKQMLIGEPFTMVNITTGGAAGSKQVEVERDCAVPEPEAGGPKVGGIAATTNMYGSYGGYTSMAMPVPAQAAYNMSPPRGYSMYAPSYAPPMTYAAPAYSPAVSYAPGPVGAGFVAGRVGYAPQRGGYAREYSYAAPPGGFAAAPTGYGGDLSYAQLPGMAEAGTYASIPPPQPSYGAYAPQPGYGMYAPQPGYGGQYSYGGPPPGYTTPGPAAR